MVLILLSAVFAAISMIRHHIVFGSSTRVEIARENAATEKERSEQPTITSPTKRFFVVVLPDGRIVNPMVANRF